ncbi:MAG: exo-alpha-sialidase [Candidatus Latescibacteria bacterium]|nr:exo-alpha-sialidase [Candidatus Latescibacterota bacterium]
MSRLPENLERKLTRLGTSLIDQQKARVLVEPTQDGPGFWFGGGNMVRAPNDDSLLLIGRYRDEGDSRTGLSQGSRGRELAIFRSQDNGRTFAKIHSWDKSDLYCGSTVVSIEGSCLRLNKRRVEVMVSTEKVRTYPRGLAGHQKPGTGVWSIDTFAASRVDRLDPQDTIQPLLSSTDPAYLHLKDPNISPGFRRGQYLLLYCAHPYSWSSSTSGYALIKGNECHDQSPDLFPRGPAWDVAASRITCRLPLPRLGALAELPPLSLYFYDGAECLRPHQAHRNAVERPRGYSCEELGGLAYGFDRDFPRLHRLSLLQPLFVSPHGTGCSRYATVTADNDGSFFALWERSSPSGGQPLVGHRLTAGRIASILA